MSTCYECGRNECDCVDQEIAMQVAAAESRGRAAGAVIEDGAIVCSSHVFVERWPCDEIQDLAESYGVDLDGNTPT